MANKTWIDPEEMAYPNGGFTRKGYVRIRKNPHNPIDLPYGEYRKVRLSIPDTYFSIPARFIYKGKTIKGFVSSCDWVDDDWELTFTPEAA